MKLTLLRTCLVAAFLGLAGAAQADVMSAPVDGAGNFTVTDNTGPASPEVFDFRVTPTTAPNPVIFYDTNTGDQSAPTIAQLIATAYGTNPATLGLARTCDAISGGCAGLTTSSTMFSLAGGAAFDYLAVHFGGGELFFHWAQPITSMTLLALDGFPGGLSNYRAYLTTPVPGALALFLGALGLLGARRKFAQRGSTAQPQLTMA